MSNETSPIYEQAAALKARVFALVRACPVGRVTTYGWLAKAVGYPRGARMIGWFMNESPAGVPAQRVINSKGELSGSWAFGQPKGVLISNSMAGIRHATSAKKNSSLSWTVPTTRSTRSASTCWASCRMTLLRHFVVRSLWNRRRS